MFNQIAIWNYERVDKSDSWQAIPIGFCRDQLWKVDQMTWIGRHMDSYVCGIRRSARIEMMLIESHLWKAPPSPWMIKGRKWCLLLFMGFLGQQHHAHPKSFATQKSQKHCHDVPSRRTIHGAGTQRPDWRCTVRQHSFSSRTSLLRAALCGHLFGSDVSGVMPTAWAACSISPASSILMKVCVVISEPRRPRKCRNLRACASALRLESG